MRNFLLLLFSLFSISCANTADTVTAESLDGEYKILEIKGANSVPEDIIFNFNLLGNRVSGSTGCNRFSAHYDQQGNKLEFSTPMNTRKYCEGKMETERKILSSLENATKLVRTGNGIVILSPNDEQLMTLIKIDSSE